MPKPNIEKIVFNVRGKKLELTSEEAKELKQILSDLFGETKVVHEYYSKPYYPYTWPYVTWCSSGLGQLSGNYSASTNTTIDNTLYLTAN